MAPRMTNNSLASVDSIDLTTDEPMSTKDSTRKKLVPKSNFTTHDLELPLLKEKPVQERHKLPPWCTLRPEPTQSRFESQESFATGYAASANRQAPPWANSSRRGFVPSPTLPNPFQNVRPGPYTSLEGRTFDVDQEMIDAAQTLLLLSKSDTNDMAQRAANEAEHSIIQYTTTAPAQNQESVFQSREVWKEGDARNYLIASGASPKARRIRDSMMKASMEQPPRLVYDTGPARLLATSQGSSGSVFLTDKQYFGHPILDLINSSPPKSRRKGTENNIVDYDMTETDDDEECADNVEETDEDEDEEAYNPESSEFESSSPIKFPSTRRQRSSVASRTVRTRKASGRLARIISSPPIEESSDAETETPDSHRSDSLPRPSTSPISQTPSRNASKTIRRDGNDILMYSTPSPPASNGLPTPPSMTSLQRWQLQARRSQSHRRSESLESFMEASKRQFMELKRQEEQEDKENGLYTPSPSRGKPSASSTPAKSVTPRARAQISVNTVMRTPQSDGLEDGEIMDESDASITTTVVSVARQQEIRAHFNRPADIQLDY